MMETDMGAWTGKVPNYLRMVGDDCSNNEAMSTISSSEKIDEDLKASAQDIASYQVTHVLKFTFFCVFFTRRST